MDCAGSFYHPRVSCETQQVVLMWVCIRILNGYLNDWRRINGLSLYSRQHHHCPITCLSRTCKTLSPAQDSGASSAHRKSWTALEDLWFGHYGMKHWAWDWSGGTCRTAISSGSINKNCDKAVARDGTVSRTPHPIGGIRENIGICQHPDMCTPLFS